MAHRLLGISILFGALLLGASCTGPSASRTEEDPSPQRVFHVQVHMTRDQAKAEAMRQTAQSWWGDWASSAPAPSRVQPSTAPVDIKWRAPLYRVRVGAFATREEAQTVLNAAQERFPDAFIAPERTGATP